MRFYGMIMNDNDEVESMILTDNYTAEEVINEVHIKNLKKDKANTHPGSTIKVLDSRLRLVAVL